MEEAIHQSEKQKAYPANRASAKDARELTKHLRRLANEVDQEEVLNCEGHVPQDMTRAELLAARVWKRATGFTEIAEVNGKTKKTVHRPEPWAVSLVFDRIEGRIPTSDETTNNSVDVTKKLEEIVVKRLNDFAQNPNVTIEVHQAPETVIEVQSDKKPDLSRFSPKLFEKRDETIDVPVKTDGDEALHKLYRKTKEKRK